MRTWTYEHAAEPKELYVVANAHHVDLYDKTDLIAFEKLGAFFAETWCHLEGGRRGARRLQGVTRVFITGSADGLGRRRRGPV